MPRLPAHAAAPGGHARRPARRALTPARAARARRSRRSSGAATRRSRGTCIRCTGTRRRCARCGGPCPRRRRSWCRARPRCGRPTACPCRTPRGRSGQARTAMPTLTLTLHLLLADAQKHAHAGSRLDSWGGRPGCSGEAAMQAAESMHGNMRAPCSRMSGGHQASANQIQGAESPTCIKTWLSHLAVICMACPQKNTCQHLFPGLCELHAQASVTLRRL